MAGEKKIHGFRVFLLCLLRIIVDGKEETCEQIEKYVGEGLASKLYENYKDYFQEIEFNPEHLDEIDKYYKNLSGCLNYKKYECTEKEGLMLVVAIVLDELP